MIQVSIRRRLLISSLFVLGAFGVLFISILRAASVRYSFNTQVVSTYTQGGQLPNDVDYGLVYPGSVLPGSFLWPVKALRDRVWVLTTPDMAKKMELYLLLADKRLGAAQVLFSQKKYHAIWNQLPFLLQEWHSCCPRETCICDCFFLLSR